MLLLACAAVLLTAAALVVVVRTWVDIARSSPRPSLRVVHAPPAPSDRVVIVSGSYGAGHDAAAREIARELTEAGRHVAIHDIVDMYPLGTGRALRRAYYAQLTVCPRSWGWVLRLLSAEGPGARALSRSLVRLIALLPSRRLADALGDDAAVVISTHPFASAALGRLRRRGELAVPVATYLTDPSVHALWVHPGVDTHLAIYPEASRQAHGHGAHGVVLVRPMTPVPVAPVTAERRSQLLEELGVPGHLPMALVVGGSEGVGELAAAAVDVSASGLVTAVVVCGHNEALRDQVASVPGAVGLPWQDGLGELIAASDCVVQNAGGFTMLESLSAGTPVISYRCLPGHGADNAAALERDGLVAWPRDRAALVDALTDAIIADRVTHIEWLARPHLVDVLELAPLPARALA